MGEAHYWELQQESTEEEWALLTADVRKILKASAPLGVRIVGRSGQRGTSPEITRGRIVFNRERDGLYLRYETFALFRSIEGSESSAEAGCCNVGFWRIAGYDLIVKSVLITAANRAPGCWHITSEGWDFEWRLALSWAQEVLGRPLLLPEGVRTNEMLKTAYQQGPLYEQAKEAYQQG